MGARCSRASPPDSVLPSPSAPRPPVRADPRERHRSAPEAPLCPLSRLEERRFPLLLSDDEFEEVRGKQGRDGHAELTKCGSSDFEASFCVCDEHWSNPTNLRGADQQATLPNWIQIAGHFAGVPAGDYLAYWHVRYEQGYEQGGEDAEERGRWGLGVRCSEIKVHERLCRSEAAGRNAFQLSSLDAAVVTARDCQQWRRLALGVLELRGDACSVHTSFGWNPRWPRAFSLCHAGLLRLSLPPRIKLLLLLGMDRRKQDACQLTRLDEDCALVIMRFLA